MKRNFLLLLIATVLFSISAIAQERIITGTITSDGNPIAKARITVKKTGTTTISDKKGKYSIKLSEKETKLVFSAPNFMRKVITVGETNIVDVSMKRITVDDLVEMSLAELLNVEVKVSSKTKENLLKASGTVFVLTSNDFANYGWRTAGEALQALPGIDLSMNYRYLDGGHRGFGNDFSETIVLIDGREIQKLRNGRASQPLMIYPLHHVERIEVLQGSASTLYGSHALQGVISIITKTADSKRKDSDVAAGYLFGDAATQELAIDAYKKTGEFYIGLSANRFYSDRDWDELGDFYSNPSNIRQADLGSNDLIHNTDPNDFNNREQDYNIQLNTEYKGIYGGVQYFGNDNLHTPGNGSFSGAYRAGIQETLIFIGYRHEFNKNINGFVEIERLFQRDEYANFHLTSSVNELGITQPIPFDETDRLENYQFDDSQRWDTKIWKYKGKIDAHIGEHNLLSIGFDIWDGDYFAANGANTFYALNSDKLDWPNTENTKYSVFFQDQLQFFDQRIKLQAGLRYNKEDFVDDSFTPRISVVGEPLKGTVFNATYSEGFRALAFGQFGQAVGSVNPTEMKMLEINYSQLYKSGKWHIMNSLSWYSMDQVGILTRKETPDQIGIIWKNTGEKRSINGIENFLKIRHERLSGFLSVYYITPEEMSIAESGEKYIPDIPKYKIKLGLSANILKHLSFNTFVDHWGETKWEVDNYDPVSRTILAGKSLHTQNSFTVININIRFNDLRLKDAGNLKFDVIAAIDNLTNKEYTHHLRPWTAMGHIQPPMRFWLKLNVKL